MSYDLKRMARHATETGGLWREEKYRGRLHLVVPVIALVGDSVVSPLGAAGPEFVPGRELAFAPSGWDGRPVVANHPVMADGSPISANRPDVLSGEQIGLMFNTRYEDGRLKTEAWIDTTAEAAAEVIERIRAGEMLEVSVGAFVASERTAGRAASGDEYQWVWSSIIPDHLAIGLNGAKGACSIDAGCGAPRAAAAEDSHEPAQPAEAVAVRAAGCGCDGGSSTGEGRKTQAPVEKEKRMPSEKQKALAGRLITCGKSPFQEADRELLETFPEERLESLADGFATTEPPAPAAPAPAAVVAAAPADKPKEQTDEELIAALPEALRSMIARYQAEDRQKREELIKTLAAGQSVFTAEQLKARTTEELTALRSMCEQVAKAAAKANTADDSEGAEPRAAAADFSGRGFPVSEPAKDVTIINPPDPWDLAGLQASRSGKPQKGTN
jgi:hypothetical protein